MPAPTKYPDWATNGGGTVVEPPAGKVAAGWVPSEQPPSGWFNWWQGLVGQWVRWLESQTTAATAALARVAYRDTTNTFSEAQTVNDLLTTETLKVTASGVGAIFDHDVQVTGNLNVSVAATVNGRLRATSTTASLFDHDVTINDCLTLGGDSGRDTIHATGPIYSSDAITAEHTMHCRDLEATDDVIAGAAGEFQYGTPLPLRITNIPLACGQLLPPTTGGNAVYTGFTTRDSAAGAILSVPTSQTFFPIRLPADAVLTRAEVMYEKTGTANAQAAVTAKRSAHAQWVATPAQSTPPTHVFLGQVILNTEAAGVWTMGVDILANWPTGYVIRTDEDYTLSIGTSDPGDKIHAVRIHWYDPGPRNH